MHDFLSVHWFAAVLLGLYVVLLIVHAKLGFRRKSDMSAFLTGSRNMTGVVIGVSFVATFASSNSYLGLSGKGYEFGLPWLLMAVMLVVFTYLSWRLVAPGLRRFTAATNAVTIPEYFAFRFNSEAARVMAGIIIVISSIFYLVAIFKGSAHLFQIFLDLPYSTSIGIMFVVVLFYTSVGGFVSVVRTDVWQGGLMIIGSVLLFYFITKASGGVGSVFELKADPDTAWIFSWEGGIPFAVLMGIALAGAMKLLIDPRQISRFYGLRDDRSVRTGIFWAVVGLLIIQFSLFPLGIYAHHLIPNIEDTDMIIPTLVQNADIFPILVADFLLVAILSAAMSSMDSVLLVSGSSLTRDVVGVIFRLTERQSVLLTRLAIILSAIVAALFALNPFGGIVEITTFSGSLYAACFAPPILLGLHWRRGNSAAVLGSFVTGLAVLLLWRGLGLSETIHEIFAALVLSTLVYVGLTLAKDELVFEPASPQDESVATSQRLQESK